MGTLDPLRLPAGFWSRSDVSEALTARDLGALFRLVSKWAGGSQTQIAIAVGMTQGQVSSFMAGKRRVSSMDVAERTLSGLDAPGPAWVAFGLAAPATPAAGMWEGAWPAGLASPATRGDAPTSGVLPDDVHRRDVLRLGGAVALGAAVAPTVRLSTTLLASTGPPADAGRLDVSELTRDVFTAWELRQHADYEALGRLLPTVIERAEGTASALGGAARDQAARLLVHAYNAASSLLRKLGDEPLALLAADRAVRAARALDDPVLTAAAMYRLANVLLSAGRAQETKDVALQAAELTEPGRMRTPRSLAMWGGLLLTAAVAAARNGEESDAWELLGEARTGGRLLGRDHADIYSIFGPTNVAIHGVQVAVELRNGRSALQRSRVVDADRLPPSLAERRAQFLIDLAHGHALENDDGEAVASLLRAEHVAPQEVRLSDEVHGLTRMLLGRERVGAVAGLRDFAGRLGVVE